MVTPRDTLIHVTSKAPGNEVSEAVDVARNAGASELALLKCTSAYPAPYEDMNIRTIPDLAKRFSVQVGLSDHTMGLGVSISAIALGATIIERHVTLSRNDGGVDSTFSLEPNELTELISECNNAYIALGKISYEKGEIEKAFKKYRRSLFLIKDLPAGHVLTSGDIKSLRPGDGLAPKYLSEII